MENAVPAVRLFTEEDLLNLDFQSKDILFFISFYFDCLESEKHRQIRRGH